MAWYLLALLAYPYDVVALELVLTHLSWGETAQILDQLLWVCCQVCIAATSSGTSNDAVGVAIGGPLLHEQKTCQVLLGLVATRQLLLIHTLHELPYMLSESRFIHGLLSISIPTWWSDLIWSVDDGWDDDDKSIGDWHSTLRFKNQDTQQVRKRKQLSYAARLYVLDEVLLVTVHHLQFVSALPITTRYRWRSLGSSVIVGIMSSIEYTWWK